MAEERTLEGRSALVTGASSGIGRAIATSLAAQGARVGITGRRPVPLAEVAAEIEIADGGCVAIPGDVRDESHVAEAVEKTVTAFGGLDVLVNNAGVIGAGPIRETSTEEWDRILDVDLKGAFLFARAAIPHLEASKGCIVNVSSVAGTRPYAGIAPYCVAKAGLDRLTECLAIEMAPAGVRVNAVNPGVVKTNLHNASGAVPDYDAFLARSEETHPLGFYGAPEDVAELVLFLVSEKSRWITGGLFPLDGGRALTSLR